MSDGLTVAEANRSLMRMLHVDLDGCRTISGARAAYVRGDIEIEEFERRVDLFLRAEAGEAEIAVLEPGEWILPMSSAGSSAVPAAA